MNQTNAFLEALRLETDGNRAVLEFAQAHKKKYGYTPPLRAIELHLIIQGVNAAETVPEILPGYNQKPVDHEPKR
jgi:hypothetical protein